MLSPILFNLHLRLLNRYLPAGVRAAIYADDLLLYVSGTDSAGALNLSESAMDWLTPWLGDLGLSIFDFSIYVQFSMTRRELTMNAEHL